MNRLLLIFLFSSLAVAMPLKINFDCFGMAQKIADFVDPQRAAIRAARKRIRKASFDYQAMHTLPLLFNDVEKQGFRRRSESYPIRQLVDKRIRVVIPNGPSADRIVGGEFVEGLLVDVSSDGKTLFIFHEGSGEHVRVPRFSVEKEIRIELNEDTVVDHFDVNEDFAVEKQIRIELDEDMSVTPRTGVEFEEIAADMEARYGDKKDGVVEKEIVREVEHEIFFPIPEEVEPADFLKRYPKAFLSYGLSSKDEAVIESRGEKVQYFLANFGYGPEVVEGRATIGFEPLKDGESLVGQVRWVDVETKAGPVRISNFELMGYTLR